MKKLANEIFAMLSDMIKAFSLLTFAFSLLTFTFSLLTFTFSLLTSKNHRFKMPSSPNYNPF
jgi:hypothetical protein